MSAVQSGQLRRGRGADPTKRYLLVGERATTGEHSPRQCWYLSTPRSSARVAAKGYKDSAILKDYPEVVRSGVPLPEGARGAPTQASVEARLKSALSDNAALLGHLRAVLAIVSAEDAGTDGTREVTARPNYTAAVEASEAAHPGAKLLERLARLEGALSMAAPLMQYVADNWEDGETERAALAAAHALRKLLEDKS